MRPPRSPAYAESVRTDEERMAALAKTADPDHRVWAAEDLAGSRHPWATATLVDALDAIDLAPSPPPTAEELAAEVAVADAIVRALALRAKEHQPARRGVVRVLEAAIAIGHEALVRTACTALVDMRAADALPALVDAFGRGDAHARDLAGAIAAIGGRAQAPLFREALRWKDERGTWAAWALGEISDRDAVPLLETFAARALSPTTPRPPPAAGDAEDADTVDRNAPPSPASDESPTFGGEDAPTIPDAPPPRALAAVVALVRLGAPSAAQFVDGALRMPGASFAEKRAFVQALAAASTPRAPGRGGEAAARVRALAPNLLAAAKDPAVTAGEVELATRLLGTALLLGADTAGEDLVTHMNDGRASACARGWAALALLEARDPRGVPFLFDFLRTNRAHAKNDPRDPYVRAVVLQQAIISALEEYGASSRRSLLAVCDLFDELRRNETGRLRPYVTIAAQAAIEHLTGTARLSEYRAWRDQAKDQTLD